jgi:hypothetical protein
MFRKYHYITSKLIAISLIVVVGLHSLNSFFNTHSHQLADGTIVTHAHPFERGTGSGPFESHHHTATELVFLASLLHFIPTIALLVVGLILFIWADIIQPYQLLVGQNPHGVPNLRGPPVCSLFA